MGALPRLSPVPPPTASRQHHAPHITHSTSHATSHTQHHTPDITHPTSHTQHHTLNITHSTSHTQHHTLNITHTTSHTQHHTHSASHARHHTLNITHSTSHTQHQTLNITHSISHTQHNKLNITHSTSHTQHHTFIITHSTSHIRHHTPTSHIQIIQHHTRNITHLTSHTQHHITHPTSHTQHHTPNITHLPLSCVYLVFVLHHTDLVKLYMWCSPFTLYLGLFVFLRSEGFSLPALSGGWYGSLITSSATEVRILVLMCSGAGILALPTSVAIHLTRQSIFHKQDLVPRIQVQRHQAYLVPGDPAAPFKEAQTRVLVYYSYNEGVFRVQAI